MITKTLLILAVCVMFVFLIGRAYDATAPSRCTEDMQCWNCETMGNQICGR